jgi:hypothetical protein
MWNELADRIAKIPSRRILLQWLVQHFSDGRVAGALTKADRPFEGGTRKRFIFFRIFDPQH